MPSYRKKVRRLNIYLIKEGLEENEILQEGFDSIDVGIGNVYFNKTITKEPDWLSFFSDHGYQLDGIVSASNGAILLVKANKRYFAITFGFTGRFILNTGVCEERFGLIVTLNCVDPKSIRSVDTKTLESEPMQVREQSTRGVEAAEFGFNPESDLVKAITGKPKEEKFGTCMVGRDALKISIQCDLNDVKGLLTILLEKFKDKNYQKNFKWIDQMKEITDREKIGRLDQKLLEEMNGDTPDKLWLTIPEIIDWDDVKGFRFSQKEDDEIFDDIHLKQFKKINKTTITLADLKSSHAYLFSSSTEKVINRWKLYDCVYSEIADGEMSFFLSGGTWYEIEKNLVNSVNDAYRKILKDNCGINFIPYSHNKESEYNLALAQTDSNNLICMDAHNIQYGGGNSKFEFCDVYSSQRKLVHIKRYSGSSTLSHLFNQGANSSEILFDEEFRKKLNLVVPSKYQILDRPNQNGSQYEIVFGVISSSAKKLDIPFFSKLSLKHVANRLKNFGYEVSLVKIDTK